MYKRYKNYIISNDYEDEDENENQIKPIQLNKEKKLNEKIHKNEEAKKFNSFKNNDFHKNKEDKINIKKVIYCEPCDKRLESNQDYLLHMSSKKHKFKMRELLREELKEYGSVRKVLIKEKMIHPFRRWRVNNVRYLLYGFSLNRYLNK